MTTRTTTTPEAVAAYAAAQAEAQALLQYLTMALDGHAECAAADGGATMFHVEDIQRLLRKLRPERREW